MKLISISVAHLNTTHTGIRIAKVFITDLAPGTTLPSPGVPVPRCGLKRQMLSIQSVLRPNQLAETRYQSLLYRDFNHFANGDTMPLKGAEESTVRELLSHIRLMSKQPKLRCETGHQASRFLRAKYPLQQLIKGRDPEISQATRPSKLKRQVHTHIRRKGNVSRNTRASKASPQTNG